MKNKTFRFMSVLLSLSMVVGSFSMPAYATQVDTYVEQEALAFGESKLEVESIDVDSDVSVETKVDGEEAIEAVEENDTEEVVDDATVDEIIDATDDEENLEDEVADEADATDEVADEADEVADEIEESVSEELIAESEEIVSEEVANAWEVGSKIKIKFIDMANYTVPGIDENNYLEVTVSEGGSILFSVIPDEGYAINDVKTNITAKDFGGNINNVSLWYVPETNTAYRSLGADGYEIPAEGLEITVETLRATKIDVQLYDVQLTKEDTESLILYYLDRDGEEYAVWPNEYGYFEFEIPTGQSIRPWIGGTHYGEDAFKFYTNDEAKPGEKLSGGITAEGDHMGILAVIEREAHRVTNIKGNYKIKAIDGTTWSDTINTKYSGEEPFEFMVKVNPGYYIEDGYYTENGVKKILQPGKGDPETGLTVKTVEPVTGDISIKFVTKKKIDLSKATVSLYFGESTKASKTVKYNAEKAKTEEGIVPTKVVVKDENGKTITSDEWPLYEVSYKNTKEAGTAYVVISGTDMRTKGKKEVPYTIQGIDMADTKKIKVEVKKAGAFTYGDPEDSIPQLEVTDISDPDNPVVLKGSLVGPADDGSTNFVIYPYGPIDYDMEVMAPGKYTLNLVGLGGYYGCRKITYNLEKPSFNNANKDEDSIAIAPIDVQNYTGKAIKPQVNVVYDGRNLVEGKDYVIKKYGNNTNSYLAGPGDAGFSTKKAPYITIAGKGNYQGTKTIYFKIDKVDVNDSSIDVTVPVYKYTGKPVAAKPVVKMVVDGIAVKTLKENTDYTLEYENNTEASDFAAVKIIPTKNGCLKVTGEDTCREARFSIAKNNIADSKIIVTLNDAKGVPSKGTVAYDFTGFEIEPKVTVMREVIVDNSDAVHSYIPLQEGVDYVVSYSNNVNVGKKATVKITGISDNYGSVTKKFTINRKTLHADDLSSISMYIDGDKVSSESVSNYDYTGYAVKPDITLIDEKNGYYLKNGVDYTLSYSNNVSVSTETKPATVTVKFKGNYVGVKSEKTTSMAANFRINSWNLDDSKVSISVNNEEKLVYTSKAIKPKVTVLSPNGRKVNPKVLKLGYANNVNAATATSEAAPTIKISPVNGYIKAPQVTAKASYVTKTFTIQKADLSKIISKIKIKDQVYKGKPIEPKISIKFAGKTLKPDKDYEVEYFDNNGRGFGEIFIDFYKSQNYTALGGVGYVMFTIK